MNTASRVLDYLQSQQAQMVSLLKDLVLMETPSDDPASQRQIRLRLKAEFEARDYRVFLLPGCQSGGHLYARPDGRHKSSALGMPGSRHPTQLMLGHCDTVWPKGTLASMPLVHEGNVIRGPGIYDMKAGLVEMLFALQTIRDLELVPSVVPLCFINSDEEIGSRESTRYVRVLARLVDRCMVLEPSLGITGKIKTARKGVGRFTIKLQGKAAHAGLDPTAGASAILELSHVIQKLFLLNDPDKGVSVNVGIIDGGVRANVVAPESSAIVDVRVETREDAQRIENAIYQLQPETPGVSLTVEGRIGRPPMEKTPSNRQFWQVATRVAEALDLPLEEGTAGGGSDGNTASLYTATLDGMGAVGDGAHATHEFIYIDQLPLRCALVTLLLLAPPMR